MSCKNVTYRHVLTVQRKSKEHFLISPRFQKVYSFISEAAQLWAYQGKKGGGKRGQVFYWF